MTSMIARAREPSSRENNSMLAAPVDHGRYALVDQTHKYTLCPRSSDPFYIGKLLYKMGHYFLYRRYAGIKYSKKNHINE